LNAPMLVVFNAPRDITPQMKTTDIASLHAC
jgi:hypothetical protein